jgi:hypothetical protein
MAQQFKKKSRRGVGQCGNPFCTEPKAPDRFLCVTHARDMDQIRSEFEEDPKLLYNQRSDNPDRLVTDPQSRNKRKPKLPTCCKPGCYELRVPPAAFCFAHEGERGSE